MFHRRYKKVGKKQTPAADEATLPVPPPPQSITSDAPIYGVYNVMEAEKKRLFKNSQTQSDGIEAIPLPPLPTDLGDYETLKKVTQV